AASTLSLHDALPIFVPAHPVFATNGVLRERLGYWAEQGIAYHLTNLNDDISYTIPDNVLACVLVHAAVGITCAAVAWQLLRRHRSEEHTSELQSQSK